jgi:spermidine/putrescine-binding protein
MTKRLILLMAVLTLIAASCGGGGEDVTDAAAACTAGEVDGDLSLYNWSDYMEPSLITDFEDQYDVSVIETFFDSNETMLAQVEAGGAVYDLAVPSDYMVSIMAENDLLVPLNKDALTNLGNLDPKFTGLPFDPNGEYSVPYQWGTTGLGFSYDVVDSAEDLTWGLIFDPELSAPLAGRISMLNDERETLGAALKYLGYSVNTTDETEVNEAADLLASARDRIATFDSDAFDDLLVSGEVDLAHGYSGDFFVAFDENDAWDDYGYGIPIEGGVAWVDNMAIPVTAEHPCTALTFINFLLDAENGAALTNYIYYASPNQAAEAYIDPEILEDPAIYPPPEVEDRLEFIADVGDSTLYADAFARAKG